MVGDEARGDIVEVSSGGTLGFKGKGSSLSYLGVGIISKSISGVWGSGGSGKGNEWGGDGEGGVTRAAGERRRLSRALVAISGSVGIGGVGEISRGGCSASDAGAVTGGGDGVWVARILRPGGVVVRCGEACPTSSVLLLVGSGEGGALDSAPGAILDLEVMLPPPSLGFGGRPGILEAGRLNAAALIRPLTTSEGSPPAALLLASVRSGCVILTNPVFVGVGSVEGGDPEAGESRLSWGKRLEGDDP
jgi:hypothetical protein